jgi:aminoglycoside phosphotransferase family enzyme
VVETPISWVVLTGQHAYKIKKPVNPGFLDFSTLEARRRDCAAGLRLNRRLAPVLYAAVVPVTGSANSPFVGGSGAAIEYAVQMREFSQSALASRRLADGALSGEHIDALATRIAAFHAAIGVAAQGCPYGTREAVIAPARDNFVPLQRLPPDTSDHARLAELRAWTEQECAALLPRVSRAGTRQGTCAARGTGRHLHH